MALDGLAEPRTSLRGQQRSRPQSVARPGISTRGIRTSSRHGKIPGLATSIELFAGCGNAPCEKSSIPVARFVATPLTPYGVTVGGASLLPQWLIRHWTDHPPAGTPFSSLLRVLVFQFQMLAIGAARSGSRCVNRTVGKLTYKSCMLVTVGPLRFPGTWFPSY